MTQKPSILFVTRALTAPPHIGCMLRTANVYRQLAKYGPTTMLAAASHFDDDSVRYCRQICDRFEQIQLKAYTDYPAWQGRFLKKWHMHFPPGYGIQAGPADQKKFAQLAARHDVVWFHTLGAAFPFKKHAAPCSVMDLDDLNHCKYDLRAGQETNPRFRCSARVQAYKWKRHEFAALKQHDIVVVCSDTDKQLLGADNICVVPNGFERPAQSPVWTQPNPNRLGFIGALWYGPNRAGLTWFRDRVWPIIRRQRPQMRLRIIGKLPAEQDCVKADGFEYTGFLPDTDEEIKTWSSLIVPIPYGGGTRIKILDAFSKMCPVVSTPVGAHGICAADGKHLLLADDPEAFAAHCLHLAQQPQAGRSLAEAGWELFCEKYTWEVIGQSIRRAAQQAVSQKAAHG